jgi:hypothetical protein
VSDTLIALGTLVVGVLATWYFARLYYVKSSREFRQSYMQLQEYITEQRDYLNKLIDTLQEWGNLMSLVMPPEIRRMVQVISWPSMFSLIPSGRARTLPRRARSAPHLSRQ